MRRRLVAIAVVVALALAAFLASRRESPTPVDTVAVARGDVVATLALEGTLINDRTVALTALLDGEITAIAVREGERAEAGQRLAALDDRQPRAMLDQARAELERERRRLEAARAAQRRRDAMGGNVSAQALEDGRLEIDAATAAVAVAVASERVAELRLENAVVRAPFDGTVTERDAEVGQWVEAGTRLFTLVANDGMVVEAAVDASDFGRVELGQRVVLATEAEPDRRWSSAVDWIAPAISDDDGGGSRFAVRLPPGDDAPPMLIGQRLDVDLEIARREDVATLPLAALKSLDGDTATALVVEDGVARARAIEVGLTTGDRAEIVSGLAPGDAVVVPFGARPVDGERVVAREP